MKSLVLVILALSCIAANAQVYRCPATYPGKETSVIPLTSATMAWGEDHAGLFAGDYSKPTEGGFDAAYPIMDDEQAWLGCSYGSMKRNKGQVHHGREWNQFMDWTPIESWVKLDRKAHNCVLHVRESNTSYPSTWTAIATCEHAP